ncbi:hypothetical protein [Stratiformator vulcanicus]|uniref:Uncharacterized protein n=1 Tax=Stratiformator vulcanicus TaxID=2527980 RepID=A0A517R244_9PLAN|nr:hypothetical protein [Stratiformator vulcanicus]QDT37938.1 hypothetical protein Pan189_23210 [Stratiformator vulcanicus]
MAQKLIIAVALCSAIAAVEGIAMAGVPWLRQEPFSPGTEKFTGDPAIKPKAERYQSGNQMHGLIRNYHHRDMVFQAGLHNGYLHHWHLPFKPKDKCPPYEPRFSGTSYVFERWAPTQSYYLPHQLGGQQQSYGVAPSPYGFDEGDPLLP